jgi:hypothetical protein
MALINIAIEKDQIIATDEESSEKVQIPLEPKFSHSQQL